MESKYTIQEAVVVLNENSELVEWFDTDEEAEEYVEEMEVEDSRKMKYHQLEKLKPYRIIKGSSDDTFFIGDVIWLSPNGHINCIIGNGFIDPSEIGSESLDFDAEEADDYEVIKTQSSEICRKLKTR